MIHRELLLDRLPVTLADLKRHIRLTVGHFDDDLMEKLLAATFSAEKFIGQIIAPSQFTLSVNFVRAIELETPVLEVREVKVDGVAITSYNVDGGSITIQDTIEGDTLEVIYLSGMENVDYDMKAAILMHSASLFNNPLNTVEQLTTAGEKLLRPFRRWKK